MSKATLEIGIYYYIDEETGEKVYDEDEIRNEFERKLSVLLFLEALNQNKDD